jgi:hypothetical protein
MSENLFEDLPQGQCIQCQSVQPEILMHHGVFCSKECANNYREDIEVAYAEMMNEEENE